MDSSNLGSGFMAVFAVSGSVVFLAMQAHKRLLSNFMKKMEFEIKNSTGTVKGEPKKKVRFASDVMADQKSSTKTCISRPPNSIIRRNYGETWRPCPKIGKLCTKGFYNIGTLGVITDIYNYLEV